MAWPTFERHTTLSEQLKPHRTFIVYGPKTGPPPFLPCKPSHVSPKGTGVQIWPPVLSLDSFRHQVRCFPGCWWPFSVIPGPQQIDKSVFRLYSIRETWPSVVRLDYIVWFHLPPKKVRDDDAVQARFNHIIASSSWKQWTKRGFSAGLSLVQKIALYQRS